MFKKEKPEDRPVVPGSLEQKVLLGSGLPVDERFNVLSDEQKPKPAPKKAMTAQEVIDVSVSNHQQAIKNNETAIIHYQEKIGGLNMEIERLENEIANLTRLNSALRGFINELEVDRDKDLADALEAELKLADQQD